MIKLSVNPGEIFSRSILSAYAILRLTEHNILKEKMLRDKQGLALIMTTCEQNDATLSRIV